MKENREFVVYNTNNPELFTVFDMPDLIIDVTHHEIIETVCGAGPYLAFFLEHPDFTFRIRGPFKGIMLSKDADIAISEHWTIDAIALPFEKELKDNAEKIKTEIVAIKENY